MSLRPRSEVPNEETWDLTVLFPDEAAFRSALHAADRDREALEAAVGSPIGSAPALAELLMHHDRLVLAESRLSRYAVSRYAEDVTDATSQALFGEVQLYGNRLLGTQAAFETRILAVARADLLRWMEELSLRPYEPFLSRKLERAEHRLSDDVEEVLSKMASLRQLPAGVYRAAIGGDASFGAVEDSRGTQVAVTPFYMLMSIETSTDTKLRHDAHSAYTEGLRPYQNTFATALGEHIQQDVNLSRIRNYPSICHSLQKESLNQVGPEHFFMVQDLMLKELTPHMRRYMRLRKRVLGIERPLLCDVKAPLASLDDDRIPFSQAQEIILESARPLGPAYTDVLQRAFTERWIYSARNAGNINQAFCGPSPVHPFVFSPFGENFYGTFILGHELGHAIHMAYWFASERPSNWEYATLFIEAPSTLMEHMIAHHLKETAENEAARTRVKMLQLLTFHHNFITHQSEAEILRRLYQAADRGEALSTATFKRTSRAVLQEFWEDTIEFDEGADLYWMRQPHYYLGLYAYTYAVGLVASTVLSQRILSGEAGLVEAWVRLLKEGSSRPPLDAFRMVGLDMSSPQPYRLAIAYVGQLVSDLEAAFTSTEMA